MLLSKVPQHDVPLTNRFPNYFWPKEMRTVGQNKLGSKDKLHHEKKLETSVHISPVKGFLPTGKFPVPILLDSKDPSKVVPGGRAGSIWCPTGK